MLGYYRTVGSASRAYFEVEVQQVIGKKDDQPFRVVYCTRKLATFEYQDFGPLIHSAGQAQLFLLVDKGEIIYKSRAIDSVKSIIVSTLSEWRPGKTVFKIIKIEDGTVRDPYVTRFYKEEHAFNALEARRL